MINFTTKSFWDELENKYPNEIAQYKGWIDEYKRCVDWDSSLFGRSPKNGECPVKYHDLPMAMQWGIFQQFCAENYPSGFGGVESTFEHPADYEKIPALITEYFAEMKSHNDNERMSDKYDDERDENGQTFDQWADDNFCR